MAARRIAQSSINWTALAEKVPENQRQLFNAFKARSDGYLRKVLVNPENPPALDWTYYKSRVTVSGLVDNFQKQMSTLNVPYPADTVSPQVDAQEKEAAKEISAYIVESNARIASYKQELAKWQNMVPYDQMTMEDFKDAFPDIALDPINKPTFWPHGEEERNFQPGAPAPASHH